MLIAGLPDMHQRSISVFGGNPLCCWAVVEKVHEWGDSIGETFIVDCHTKVDTKDALGLCADHAAEIVPTDVRFESCPAFRTPLEGDLFSCASCGYWAEDHGESYWPEGIHESEAERQHNDRRDA